ncbi:ABC-type transport auxiliary lipoprotein family protein [Sphingopyxis panaciterrulae]|uniref:Cholesterol transport system auxiliary component n=1 Tax=Sphingopyxis panaciterrulae TaxID=462372 RepID=A0A7W9ESJ7_9SPHN|nr:ABC-type transport auxiliary lipoprotein family protein [Sphingopyxis panaciterrulae]MBB5707026.1 cholesterol transport system auxiliary component [Sphingopyxis panaciterrulae]
MSRSLRTPMLAALGAATLSACVSFGSEPPPFLLTLTADAAPAAGQARTTGEAEALTILIPTAPQKLRTQRIPVQQDDASIAYVKDAQWVEAPQRLFQRLLSETVAARTNRVILDEGQYLTAPGEQLAGQLLDFGVDEATNEAVVVYQAMLVGAGGKSVTQRRFEAREPIGGKIEAKRVGEALTTAANKVAGDVAGWLAG